MSISKPLRSCAVLAQLKGEGKKRKKSRVEEVGSCESRGRIVVPTGQLLVHPIAGARWFVPLTKWRIRKSFSRKLSLAFPLSLYHPTLLPIAIPPPSESQTTVCFISFSDGSSGSLLPSSSSINPYASALHRTSSLGCSSSHRPTQPEREKRHQQHPTVLEI